MIKYLPVFTIVAVIIYLSIKVFDWLLETAVYFHCLHNYRLVFDDYEAGILEMEVEVDSDALKELKA